MKQQKAIAAMLFMGFHICTSESRSETYADRARELSQKEYATTANSSFVNSMIRKKTTEYGWNPFVDFNLSGGTLLGPELSKGSFMNLSLMLSKPFSESENRLGMLFGLTVGALYQTPKSPQATACSVALRDASGFCPELNDQQGGATINLVYALDIQLRDLRTRLILGSYFNGQNTPLFASTPSREAYLNSTQSLSSQMTIIDYFRPIIHIENPWLSFFRTDAQASTNLQFKDYYYLLAKALLTVLDFEVSTNFERRLAYRYDVYTSSSYRGYTDDINLKGVYSFKADGTRRVVEAQFGHLYTTYENEQITAKMQTGRYATLGGDVLSGKDVSLFLGAAYSQAGGIGGTLRLRYILEFFISKNYPEDTVFGRFITDWSFGAQSYMRF